MCRCTPPPYWRSPPLTSRELQHVEWQPFQYALDLAVPDTPLVLSGHEGRSDRNPGDIAGGDESPVGVEEEILRAAPDPQDHCSHQDEKKIT